MTDITAPRLYLISPIEINLTAFARELKDVLTIGNIAAFQLRLPNDAADDIQKAAICLGPICRDNDVAFILWDDVDLAKKLDCDGVHLETDCNPQTIKAARQSLGDNALIGASVMDSKHDAMLAAEASADYVSIGPIFYTKTMGIYPKNQIEMLAWWSEYMEIPCVAVGGLTPDNCDEVVKTGAEYIAVISALWTYPDGAAAGVSAFNNAISKACH